MTWVLALLGVVLLTAVVLVAVARGSAMVPAHDDRREVRLPEHPLGPDDLGAVRFTTSVRGYRPAEVDDLLARLAAEMRQRSRDEEPYRVPRHPVDPDDVTQPPEAPDRNPWRPRRPPEE